MSEEHVESNPTDKISGEEENVESNPTDKISGEEENVESNPTEKTSIKEENVEVNREKISGKEENIESKPPEKTSTKEEKTEVKSKVDILLKATGDTPIMKNKKWAVESDRTIGSISVFFKKYLKMESTDSLYLYVNQSFAPSPDQIILNLFECFGSDGKLVLHYCKTPAWG